MHLSPDAHEARSFVDVSHFAVQVVVRTIGQDACRVVSFSIMNDSRKRQRIELLIHAGLDAPHRWPPTGISIPHDRHRLNELYFPHVHCEPLVGISAGCAAQPGCFHVAVRGHRAITIT